MKLPCIDSEIQVSSDKIPQTELTHKDWTKMIVDLLENMQQHLDYLPGKQTFKRYMNGSFSQRGFSLVKTDRTLLEQAGRVISPEASCWDVCPLPYNSPSVGLSGDWYASAEYTKHRILLTEKGQLLLLSGKYHSTLGCWHEVGQWGQEYWHHCYITDAIDVRAIRVSDINLTLVHDNIHSQTSNQGGEVRPSGKLCEGGIVYDGLCSLIQGWRRCGYSSREGVAILSKLFYSLIPLRNHIAELSLVED